MGDSFSGPEVASGDDGISIYARDFPDHDGNRPACSGLAVRCLEGMTKLSAMR